MPRIFLPEKEMSNFDTALSLVPEIKDLYDRLYHFLWEEVDLPKDVKEKVRLLLANINGCQTCMSLSYTGDPVWNGPIKRAVNSSDYSGFMEFDRKLFSFITKYRWDPKEITDEETAWLGMHFTETQIIKLLALINLFDGFHKMIVSLDLYDFCSIGGSR
ncbi:hypothetical protein [Neobacillus terrae]|uniref:hypothetical protein n=1 Tax=Neobacillus terrae TaxID=3034837 RepID=UPI00140BC3FC|nr:hypothetical protein [Neobacillus terrae]NHM33523.1 hypothetical protein [Neobacillus terrae]